MRSCSSFVDFELLSAVKKEEGVRDDVREESQPLLFLLLLLLLLLLSSFLLNGRSTLGLVDISTGR